MARDLAGWLALATTILVSACASSEPESEDVGASEGALGSCSSFLDCKQLDEPRDCPGRFSCRNQACVYECSPESALEPWDPSVGATDCRAEWAAGLSPCDRVKDKYVVVRKSAHNLALCERGELVENIRIGLGSEPGDKEREGDNRTPEGVFYVPKKNPQSAFRRSFFLSYPDAADAERGLRAGMISRAQYDAIVSAHGRCAEPPQTTALGGLIALHGGGAGFDWTWGCVAVSNVAIARLWSQIDVGDTIVVRP